MPSFSGDMSGQKVQAVIRVVSKEVAVVVGKFTDEKQIVVKGLPPSQLTTFTEVIGIADSQNSFTADIWTHFGDSFGAAAKQ